MEKCLNCNKLLEKNVEIGEDGWSFKKRKYCDRNCYWKDKKTWNHKKQVLAMTKSNTGKKHSVDRIERGRKKIRESVKKLWENLDYRNGQIERRKTMVGNKSNRWKGGKENNDLTYYKKLNTPREEWNRKISKSLKDLYTDKTKHPCWKNGSSLLPYSNDFTKQLKFIIRKRDKFKCKECGYSEKRLKYNLSIHHIDYNKNNSNFNNLISLCKSCHAKTNFEKKHWISYYKQKTYV